MYSKKSLTVLILLLGVALVLSFAGFAQDEKVKKLPREETLYLAGIQWGPPETWSPIAAEGTWPVANRGDELLYETLFAYNMLNSELEPLLAESYEWVDDLTVEIHLNEKAHWNNGEPVTAEDVVYTFNLGNKYSLEYSDMWDYVEKVYSVDEHTVRIEMDEDNPNRFVVLDKLAYVWIMPKSVMQDVEEKYNEDLVKIRSNWKNENPVASGPYELYSFNDQRIVLRRNENYWGEDIWGEPGPRYFVHPIFKSNDAGNRAFEKGQVDVSQQFMPQIWETWLVKDLPVKTWYSEQPYHVPFQLPSLRLNLHMKPMDDPQFRRALAHAIDYEKIAQLAMTRYSDTMQPGLVLPFGSEKKYLDEEEQEEYGWEHDPEKAEELLQEAGYTQGADGWYDTPDGEDIGPLTVECPYGWTDWNVSLKIVAQGARQVGINMKTRFPEFPEWFTRLQKGDFELAMWSPVQEPSPAQPWRKFERAMGSIGLPEMGEIAYHNYGRYRNEKVNEIIMELPKMTEESERIEAIKELNKIFMQDIPMIPLEYRPYQFYEVNETYWKNFPTADNPYAPPTVASFGAGIRTIYNIEPVE